MFASTASRGARRSPPVATALGPTSGAAESHASPRDCDELLGALCLVLGSVLERRASSVVRLANEVTS